MYLDSRPVSTFQHTSGWSMATPQPPSTLRRPPITKAAGSSSSSLGSQPRLDLPSLSRGSSSSSSLGGMEQHVPSFQSFIKKTPSVGSKSNKPLPPTPLESKRSYNSLKDALERRSSSVYSRTPSQFRPQTPSWKAEDPEADSPLLFRPMAYSASEPDLSISEDLTPTFLEPRVFSPLIESPRTTTVASTSPSQSRLQSMLTSPRTTIADSAPASPAPLPFIDTRVAPAKPTLTSPIRYHGHRQPMQTISLEKAKEALKAPGAVRFLPEELRAQALNKVRSQGHMRLDSIDIFGGAQKAPLLPAIPNMIDQQGRERALPTPSGSMISRTDFAFRSPSLPKTSAAYNAFPVGTGPVREMAPPQRDSSGESRVTWRQLSHDGEDKPRGRTVERRSYERNSQSSPKPIAKDVQPAQVLANEYHSLLKQQQYRQASESPGYSSDESVRTHMKMVPQPLFQAKMPPKSRQDSDQNSNSSVSPSNIHRKGRSDSTTSSANRSTGFGLRLSLETPDSVTRYSSTTGMIPISPPTEHDMKRPGPPHLDTKRYQPNPLKKISHGRENSRESSFYPHIMQRKTSRKTDLPIMPPGKPLLAGEVIAQKLKTRESTPDTSPMSPIVAALKPSSVGGTDKDRKKFYQRFGKNRRRSSTNKSLQSDRDDDAGKASPTSPHLFPSPVSKTSNVHLGWSDYSKCTFDESRSPPSTPRGGGPTRLTNIFAPSKALDESKDEPESPTTRRPSLLGSVLESWRESKAQKRREDLKRLIRVVPVDEEEDGEEEVDVGVKARSTGLEASGAGGGGRRARRMSAGGWM